MPPQARVEIIGLFVYRAIGETVDEGDADQGVPHPPAPHAGGVPHCTALHDTGNDQVLSKHCNHHMTS